VGDEGRVLQGNGFDECCRAQQDVVALDAERRALCIDLVKFSISMAASGMDLFSARRARTSTAVRAGGRGRTSSGSVQQKLV